MKIHVYCINFGELDVSVNLKLLYKFQQKLVICISAKRGFN